jgi:hypothetical protein
VRKKDCPLKRGGEGEEGREGRERGNERRMRKEEES